LAHQLHIHKSRFIKATSYRLLAEETMAATSKQKGRRRGEVEKASALILVVERNPAVQELEKFFLEKAGYHVEFASDGLTALELAKQLCPVILVTEALVPRLDGLSLSRRLKGDPNTCDIIVLVVSHLQAEERAREAGADAFLYKPLAAERLVNVVEQLIAAHGQNQGATSR
jgi:CheY-like chemotaxis protein